MSKHPPARVPVRGSFRGRQADASHKYWVYIVASPSRTIYTGVTNDLERRMWEHKQNVVKGFTSEYGVNRLVWFEAYRMIDDAIAREKWM